jgi:Resolvase, N terminal domain
MRGSRRSTRPRPIPWRVHRGASAADGLLLPDALPCIDEGYSGAALVQAALERLRALVVAGAVNRLYVHSPDRLARKYAYQWCWSTSFSAQAWK